MKVWLDDLRTEPPGWTRARTMGEAQDLLLTHIVEEMSLDHDLGTEPPCDACEEDSQCQSAPDECRCDCHRQIAPTGYDLVKWMAQNDKWPRKKPKVHSQNPVGRANIQSVIDRYWFDPHTH